MWVLCLSEPKLIVCAVPVRARVDCVHYVCSILVGAPEAQTDQPSINKAGAVYTCGVNDANCQQIVVDTTGQYFSIDQGITVLNIVPDHMIEGRIF